MPGLGPEVQGCLSLSTDLDDALVSCDHAVWGLDHSPYKAKAPQPHLPSSCSTQGRLSLHLLLTWKDWCLQPRFSCLYSKRRSTKSPADLFPDCQYLPTLCMYEENLKLPNAQKTLWDTRNILVWNETFWGSLVVICGFSFVLYMNHGCRNRLWGRPSFHWFTRLSVMWVPS